MRLQINPILATDSYKLSHFAAYPKNVLGMYSYIAPRIGNKTIIPVGLQMWIQKFLTIRITEAHIDEAEIFASLHGEPFNRDAWEYIRTTHGGYLPVVIRAVPEGTPVPSGMPIVTIECTDPKVFWLSSYLETALQRAVWYPTTIASMDYSIKKDIEHFYRISGADMSMLPFALHDFGARGVTCAEQAEIGGFAHLVNFMGSDNIEGVRAANYYYSSNMAAFSVPATEHSVECSFGGSPTEELEYLRNTITELAKPGGIVSIVIDGYDVYRAAELLCTELRDLVKSCGAKVVFRPDSGDMMEVVPRILRMQELAFGSVTNAKGYKKINTVGIIQGDGVDHMAIKSLLGKVLLNGYSADNVIFGSGGALLQKVDRDTFKFAQKASAILVREILSMGAHGGTYRDIWKAISKNPITDPGKKSLAGRVTLIRSKLTGEYMVGDMDKDLNSEFESAMVVVYNNGMIQNKTTLEEIRKRASQ